MLERLTDRLGKKAVRGLTVGTFHAICLGLVPPRPFISRAQALETVKTLLDEHGERLSPAEALRLLSLYKNGLHKRTPAVSALPAWLPDAYDSRLGELGLRDLDGLMLEALEVDVSGRRGFTCLLVDEFQDINPVQHALIAHWSKAGQSLFVIGDPDQAIYGFRGADADCFARLLSQNPDAQVMRLTRNYRSTPQVLALAARVISKNPGGERALIPTVPMARRCARFRPPTRCRRASGSPGKLRAWPAVWTCWTRSTWPAKPPGRFPISRCSAAPAASWSRSKPASRTTAFPASSMAETPFWRTRPCRARWAFLPR